MKILFIVTLVILIICMMSVHVPDTQANGWATAGKILAGVAGADLIFNGRSSMVGRTVTGVGNVFTGGTCCAQPAPCGYYYSPPPPPPPRRCWDEIRRVPSYDRYGRFLGYFDERVTVCTP